MENHSSQVMKMIWISAKICISCVLGATKFHSTQSWQLEKSIFHIEGCLESCAMDYKFITFSALKTLHFQLHLSPLCGSHKTTTHYQRKFQQFHLLICYMLEASNASSIYCIVLRFGKWVLQVVIFYFRRILWCRPRVLHRWIPREFSEVQKGCPKENAAQQGGKKVLN